MIRYDRLWDTMAARGISQYRLIKQYHFSAGQIGRLKKNMHVSTHTLDTLCALLNCDISDILEYIPDPAAAPAPASPDIPPIPEKKSPPTAALAKPAPAPRITDSTAPDNISPDRGSADNASPDTFPQGKKKSASKGKKASSPKAEKPKKEGKVKKGEKKSSKGEKKSKEGKKGK